MMRGQRNCCRVVLTYPKPAIQWYGGMIVVFPHVCGALPDGATRNMVDPRTIQGWGGTFTL